MRLRGWGDYLGQLLRTPYRERDVMAGAFCHRTLRSHGALPKLGNLVGRPHNKDYSILRSILGSPYFGKQPHPLPNSTPLMQPEA